MKCKANWVLKSLKVLIELGVNLLNQILTGPFNVVGKALQIISFDAPWRCIRVMKNSKWSKGSLDPSKFSTCGIQNFGGSGNEVMDAMNDESVRWTKSSRSLDTRLLRVFIIKFICSFIICISATIWGGTVSVMDGWLVSRRFGLLGALLPSSPSWFHLSTLVLSWSSPWVFITTFFWRNCSSRSWFYLVRGSTATARVWTCLSWAVVHGSSPWLLVVVAIEQVSTMQLFVRKAVNRAYLLFPTNDAN